MSTGQLPQLPELSNPILSHNLASINGFAIITRTECDMSSNLLFVTSSIKERYRKIIIGKWWKENDRRRSKKLWYSSAILHFINYSVLEDQFTLNSEWSESIPECTYIEQYCKNIFLTRQEAINQCDRQVWRKECFGQGDSEPWTSWAVTRHF